MTYAPPAIGDIYEHDGCRYTFKGDPRPHVTRDGRTVILYAWELACVECGAPRPVRFGHRPGGKMKKRCEECAAPFIRAKKRKGGAA